MDGILLDFNLGNNFNLRHYIFSVTFFMRQRGYFHCSPFLWYTVYMPYEGNRTKLVHNRRERLKEPDEYRVILLNDNYTTMEFVVEILMVVFHKQEEDATRIMLDVHRKGKGTVGVYPWDIAQTKTNQVHNLARQSEFPLKCIVEKA